MKKKTRWKRVYNPIIGVRFFEGGEYGLGFFTIEKLWRCKEYCGSAIAPDGTRWFEMFMMKVRTDTGLVYKMPFIPWMKASDTEGKMLSDYYDANPYMSKSRLCEMKKDD